MVTATLAVAFVLVFVLGLLCMKPLDAFLQRREMRGSLPPARRALLKPDPRVHCSHCHRDVMPQLADWTGARGWTCKSHQKPAPVALVKVAA